MKYFISVLILFIWVDHNSSLADLEVCTAYSNYGTAEEIVSSVNIDSVLKSLQNKCEFAGPLHKDHPISTFWAQQMTGADLVREELNNSGLNFNITEEDLLVIDVDGGHGENVSNLIAAPFESALIPQQTSVPYFSGSTLTGFENVTKPCLQERRKACPKYINNSDFWRDESAESKGIATSEVVKNLSKAGGIVVVSSGNEPQPLEEPKERISEYIIPVAASTSSGEPTWWSSFSSSVVISAPSDEILHTRYYNGEESDFGGTSGSAPQVTAALLNFYKVSGHHLSIDQAKKLLADTALPYLGQPASDKYGAGILNTYKIFEVAKKVKSACQASNDPDCFQKIMSEDSLYSNLVSKDESEKILSRAKEAFPGCAGRDGSINSNCSVQEKIFSDLRRLALLDNNHEAWKLLDCMTQNSLYQKNNIYYARMSGRNVEIASTQKPEIEYESEPLIREEYENKIEEFLSGGRVDFENIDDLLYQVSEKLPANYVDLVQMIVDNEIDTSLDYFPYDSLRIGDKLFADKPDLIDKLLDRNNEMIDELVAELYSWQDHWPIESRKKWRNVILSRRTDLDYLFITHHREYSSSVDNKFLVDLISRGNIDRTAIDYLPHSFWENNPESLLNIARRGEASEDIARQLIPYLPEVIASKVIDEIKKGGSSSVLSELERQEAYRK